MSTTNTSDSSLIPPRFLFRFTVEVHHCEPLWSTAGVVLNEKYSLPVLAQLDGQRQLAEMRMAWSSQGLAWWVRVEGKSQLPWCRDSRLEDSDGLQVWVDTRATMNVHRASRFCHRYVFLPRGGGHSAEEPVADQLLINRARENARPIRPRELQVKAKVTKTGYEMSAFAPLVALYGFDPVGSPRLGFTYALLDREQGLQTFAAGTEFPYEEDPSCWAEVLLVE
ncbi:hypothetical protein [Bythopirellula polymerisocia]|uniref:Carbohydrate-binding domain-containing protein n=1 Tax=Bythopirellula polymerisocia TaxID=2528003 RepID=A0A5C6D048_9BACT|nr:hypothetical protein [Bythopirellula polymerisocia]TWU30068.1 hypothetical protein Pla144_08540 [Bythopirellula polymerisocia]